MNRLQMKIVKMMKITTPIKNKMKNKSKNKKKYKRMYKRKRKFKKFKIYKKMRQKQRKKIQLKIYLKQKNLKIIVKWKKYQTLIKILILKMMINYNKKLMKIHKKNHLIE